MATLRTVTIEPTTRPPSAQTGASPPSAQASSVNSALTGAKRGCHAS